MRKLALTNDILMTIDKPARYIGGEVNSVMKDKDKIKTRFAMVFPDVYEVGMSHLGIQILYHMLNTREDIWCERVYSPWMDLDPIMRERRIPLFALESQDPIKDFDFIGITIQYEMCYTNILQILDLGQIPWRSKDRAEDDPIVIGGGPCTYNPEPLAPFFDCFYIGEGETSMLPLVDLRQEMKAQGRTRREFLHEAAKIPGIYVPSMYEVTYKEDGTIASFEPIYDDIPRTIRKEIVREMSDTYYPEAPVIPFIKAIQDRVVMEIQRGCIRGCRFCQAGMIYRPVRERSLEYLTRLGEQMLESTGHEEISLSSLSSSDYSQLKPLLNNLIDECDHRHVNISLPSLRIDSFSLDVMSKVQDVKKSSITFAPEAGTQRMRNVINKGLTEENILEGAATAFHGGWTKVKLYFMLGLPTETEEDMIGIAELSEKVAMRFYDEIPKDQRKNGRVQVTSSSSFFIPKPFTPFQWATMERKEEYIRRARLVKDAFFHQLNHKSMHFQYHDADVTILEGVLARGDRRCADVLDLAYKKGCIYDAWTEYFKYDTWMEAFAELGIDHEFYTMRKREDDEIFPWDFIDIGVTKKFLLREWHRSQEALVTPNCKQQCSGCGAASFHTGICYVKREEGHVVEDQN